MGKPVFDTGTVDLVGMADFLDLTGLQLKSRLGRTTREVMALSTADTCEKAMDMFFLTPARHELEEPALWTALSLAKTADDVWGVYDQARAGSPLKEASLLKLARFCTKG